MGCCSSSEEKENEKNERSGLLENDALKRPVRPVPPLNKVKKKKGARSKMSGRSDTSSGGESDRDSFMSTASDDDAQSIGTANTSATGNSTSTPDGSNKRTGKTKSRSNTVTASPLAQAALVASPSFTEIMSPTTARNSRKSVANFVLQSGKFSREEILELFKMVDLDGDGVVTREELSKMMKHIGLNPSQEDVDVLFTQLDINGDEFITFDEFVSGIRWTYKTLQLDKVADSETIEMKKQHIELMSQYIQLMTHSSLEKAKNRYKEGNMRAARSILNVVDLDLVLELQTALPNNELINDEQLKLYKRLSDKLQA